MKSVLISIRPKWCELIACGKKTIEIRKTAPIIATPFKCYIYCTDGAMMYSPVINYGRKMVIGEFVCDFIEPVSANNRYCISKLSCVPLYDLYNYAGAKGLEVLKGWHISDLVIYDEPKELDTFHKPCETSNCWNKAFREAGHCLDKCFDCGNRIKIPPQSWCYVEG